MNKLDKYKRIISELDKLYISPIMESQKIGFSVFIRTKYSCVCYDDNILLYDDLNNKETDYNKILEICKNNYEEYLNELIKYKTK
jgi:hypothetical protein